MGAISSNVDPTARALAAVGIADAAAAQSTANDALAGGHFGQAWQDMTASRALNTSYVNTTGRAIMVKMWSAPTEYFAESVLGITGEGAGGYSLTYIVPAGASYGQVSNQGAPFTFTKWMELR